MKGVTAVHITTVHSCKDLRIFHKECKSLAQAGYEVTVIAPGEGSEEVDGIRIIPLPKFNHRFTRITLSVWRAWRTAVRLKAEVYHFHDPELIPVGLLLRTLGKKVIYDIHEDMPKEILFKEYLPVWLRSLLGWMVKAIENVASPRFSALVSATPEIAKRFKALNDGTVVIQNFPVLDGSSAESEVPWIQRAHSVAYVGDITRVRGIREMAEAMARLPESLHATLRLAGRFFPPRLRKEIASMRGWERIEELGVVDPKVVTQVLSEVRAGLVVFQPCPNHVASQPTKLFEYMAAGIPVIASDFPLWRKIIRGANCGILVDPQNPKAIAEAIEYLLTRPSEAEKMGRCGRKAAENTYNWAIEKVKLLELYARLAS